MTTLKYKHLIKVEGEGLEKNGLQKNNNKYYQMQENADGTFTATYGRVGAAKPATEIYPMSKWDVKLKEKLGPRKGYEDITHLVAVAKQTSNTSAQEIHKIPAVVELIKKLQEAANLVVAQQYLVKSDAVTQMQIDEAQRIVNNLSNSFRNYFGKREWSVDLFNAELKKLFKVIPRKMKNVVDHLITANTSKANISKQIDDEQGYLDAMAGQVVTNTAANTSTPTSNQTLLDKMGLEMNIADAKEFEAMKKMLDYHGHRLQAVFKVKNRKTQEAFDKNYNSVPATKKKTQLFFHGSRSQNWIFILEQGLKIRPSGAVHTGSMFGDGVYFADDADKSLGYTDNGRWVNGKAHGSVYMGVYKVRVGNQKILGGNDYGTSNLHKTLDHKNYCSVYAKKGNQGLRKSEFIIYNHDQSTIEYLLQIKA